MTHDSRTISRAPRLGRLRGRFYAVYYDGDGKRRRFALGTDDRAEAERRMLTWEPPKRRAVRSVIYFIRCECPEKFVKIGVATDVRSRLSGFAVASPYPLTLLGTIPGGEVEERALHARFARQHHRGEWFRPSPDLDDYIEQHRSQPIATASSRRPAAANDDAERFARALAPAPTQISANRDPHRSAPGQ